MQRYGFLRTFANYFVFFCVFLDFICYFCVYRASKHVFLRVNIKNRFYLIVDPDRAATSVENVGEEAKGDKAKDVEKFLIDGKLFIRTADGIFDAKGQRL